MEAPPYVRADNLQREPWSLAARLSFRFCFLYFGLYSLSDQILGGLLANPILQVPGFEFLPSFRQLMTWIAAQVFGYNHPLVYRSGSGDKVLDWVTVFFLLVVAGAGTCLWSILNRKRSNYDTLYKWFRVFIRFALAGQMFLYGTVKVFPLQMPFPQLTRLLERFGAFSPMGVLWYSVGAAPAYERFVGAAELLGGLLLLLPVTSMLGALISLVDMIQVFALNMTYDVPVKLFSLHLILFSAFLLLPDRRRLLRVCLPHCTLQPSGFPQLFTRSRANRVANAVLLLFGLWLLGTNLYGAHKMWYRFGGGVPQPALYGIWNVDEMRIDGVVRAPLVTDYERWRRVIFDRQSPGGPPMMLERMDDTFAGSRGTLEKRGNAWLLTMKGAPALSGQFTVERQGPNRLTMDGHLGAQKIRMQLSLVPRDQFLLVNRGFHWVQEFPFNR